MVYDPISGLAVDSTEALNGADLVLGNWVDVELPNPINIDYSQPLMFGYRVNQDTGYPAGAASGPAIEGFGDLIKLGSGENGEWVSMSWEYGINYNWNLAGYVDFPSQEGRTIISSEPHFNGSTLVSLAIPQERALVDPVYVGMPGMDIKIDYCLAIIFLEMGYYWIMLIPIHHSMKIWMQHLLMVILLMNTG